MKGIDISEWQGKEFSISEHDVDFVIIRLGYAESKDKYAEEYIAQANKLGLPWGVYWYSYALTVKDALAEAGACLKFLNKRKPPLGVWIDMEDADSFKAKNGMPDSATITAICREFCQSMKDHNLFTGVYASESWFGWKIGATGFPKWIASWGYNDGINYPNLSDKCMIQQYRGYPLDLDIMYAEIDDFKVLEDETVMNINYDDAIAAVVSHFASEVLDGKWDNGDERKRRIGEYFYNLIQSEVNRICGV